MAHHSHPSDVRYGPGAIRRLAETVSQAGARRVLLVCGQQSFEASGAAAALPALEEVAEVTRWSDVTPNPDTGDLAVGLELLDATTPDVVIGVGGGSYMDMAKLLCAFAGTPAESLATAIDTCGTVTSRDVGLVLAPTTSGSGSEATHFAVVYIGDKKYSIAGPGLYADTVMLDPDLARSGSAHQRATSGVDAICQSIESLWATGSTSHSRQLARRALGLLRRSIEEFVHQPSDRSARAMCIGSHLAGRAIDISKTTAAHALSYAITKRYGIDHGNAVALTLGQFIEAHAAPDAVQRLNDGADPDRFSSAVGTIVDELGGHDGASAHAAFTDLLRRLDLVTTLQDAGLTTDRERADLVATVNLERLGNNPVGFDTSDLLALVERA